MSAAESYSTEAVAERARGFVNLASLLRRYGPAAFLLMSIVDFVGPLYLNSTYAKKEAVDTGAGNNRAAPASGRHPGAWCRRGKPASAAD
jgi:hypothetical protein